MHIIPEMHLTTIEMKKGKRQSIYLRILNRSSRRKRGIGSNPLFIISDFFLHFPNELSYGYLGFEGNGKIPLGS